jgi:hypothetical protein
MSSPSQGLLTGFAGNVKRLMDLRGVGPGELAERADMSPARLEEILGARSEAGALEVMRLAAALEGEPAELFDGLTWVADGEGGGEYRYTER